MIIREYDFLQYKNHHDKHYIDEKTFIELENFVLDNQEVSQYLKIASKKGFGKVLQAQNYVGIIQTKSGITIEILPKITNLEENIDESKKILIKMIKTLNNPTFKNIDKANLKKSKMPLFEIFIKMFLDELATLMKSGIKSDYLQEQDNLNYLKGKLLIKQQIKKNFFHKERFFTEFDEYSINRVENKLIKTTLMFLLKKSKNTSNKKLIKRYLIFFDSVKLSYNIKSDFNKVRMTRELKKYKTVISWAEVFLLNDSFSTYNGKHIAFSLLFDMNLLFESYVSNYLKKECLKFYPKNKIKFQDKAYHLAYKKNKPVFQLKPDIVIETPNEIKTSRQVNSNVISPIFQDLKSKQEVIVLDTKWKIPVKSQNPSSKDMYQLYAYGMKYENCNKLYLIYPLVKEKLEKLEFDFNPKDQKELKLKVLYFDLKNDKIL